MGALSIIYARNRTPLSILLRNSDRWGKWSHCGIVTLNSTVIEARALEGVVETPIAEFTARYTRTEVCQVECPTPLIGILWAIQQIGKPYDWAAIFGNLLREGWQKEEAWQCAELVEAALVMAGRRRFHSAMWRIAPNLSAMVV